MESQKFVTNAALNFDMEYAGRRAIDLVFKDVQSNFNGQVWAGIGPYAVTRVFRIMCGTVHVSMGRLKDSLMYINLTLLPWL